MIIFLSLNIIYHISYFIIFLSPHPVKSSFVAISHHRRLGWLHERVQLLVSWDCWILEHESQNKAYLGLSPKKTSFFFAVPNESNQACTSVKQILDSLISEWSYVQIWFAQAVPT